MNTVIPQKIYMALFLACISLNFLSAQYDVALALNTINTTPVKYGTSVPFNVTVYNQSSGFSVQNIDVIVRTKAGFVFDPAINTIWSPDPMIPNAYITRITSTLVPLANELITINLRPQPGLDSTLWDISAEIFYVEDISGNDVSILDFDSPHDKNNTNDGGGLIDAPSDGAINGNGNGLPFTASAATDEDDQDVSYVRIYDVALKKLLITPGPHKYGDVLQFNSVIYNQGNENTGLVLIQELIPEGYIYDSALNTPGWTGTAPKPKYGFDNLKPGDSIVIPVKLILSSEQFDGLAWNNYTEVFSVRDRNNVNVGPNEADSTPNTNSIYENDVLPGSPFDNQILGNGQSENEDEDDHDVATPRIFDLAIRKQRQTSVPSYSYIQNVIYNITVFNQGNVDANSVTIVDTIPCGLEFLPALNPGWSISSPGKISFTSNTTIPAATSRAFTLTFGVNPCYVNPKDGWTNYIEIHTATPADGGSNADIDGVFDNSLINDFQFNNLSNNDVIDKVNVNEDEDNHDLEKIQVVDMALRKTLVTSPPYVYGQNLTFKIVLFNQGNVSLTNVKVKDYIPQGYQYLAINTTNGWNPIDTTYLVTRVLRPLDSFEIFIQLKLQTGDSRKDWINYAHIINVQDTLGNNRFDDADSFPILNETETTIEPGSAADNNIFVLGPSNQNRDEDDHDPAGFEVLDLALNKTIKNPVALYNFGDPISFDIDVINEAGTAASKIEVTDYLPCGFTFSTANNPGWTQSGALLKYVSNASLSAGDTLSLVLNLSVAQCANPTASSWKNKAEISMSIDSLSIGLNDMDSNPDSNPSNDAPNEDDIDSSGIKIFDLSLDKVLPVVSTGLKFGNLATFTFNIKNEGNTIANNVVVTDYLPCGLSFSTVGNAGWSASGSNVNYTIPTINPGQTITLALSLTVVSCSAVNAYKNIAEISAANDGSVPGNDVDSTPDTNPNNDPTSEDDHDTETISVDGSDLSLDKSIANVPANATYGSTITYNITVSNQGIVPASNVQIVDYIRCGYAFSTTGNTGWSLSGGKLFYTIAGPIAPSNSITVPLQLQLQYCSNSNARPYANKAEISISPSDNDSTPDSNPDNDPPGEDDIDSTAYEVYDLSLTKTLINPQSSYTIGQSIAFNITVKNEGTLVANNVKITDYLPCGFTFNTSGNSGWALNSGNGYYEYTIPSLAIGQTVVLTLNVTTASCGTINAHVNKAEISSGNLVTGGPGVDIDSTPDNNPNNDPEDEDDSDSEPINVVQQASIGDFVWNDNNGNGLQDGGELGIGGVFVQLFSNSGMLIQSTTTNAAGIYIFNNVQAGSYYLKFTPASQYTFIDANVGSNDNIDSDVTGSNGVGTTSLFNVIAGVNSNAYDAGLYVCSKIGDLVWYDVDKDDIHDLNENGINGLTVELYRQINGSWIFYDNEITGHKPNTPSDDGYFQFCVPPGTYHIKVVMPPLGFVQAKPNILGIIPIGQANEQNNDSDLTNANGAGTTPTFVLVSGQNILTIGAGFYPMATAGNLVWEDTNANGKQEAGEPKIAAVLVEAFDQNNQKIGQDITDNDGIYKIDYLGKNNYYLRFTPPQGYGMTVSNSTYEDEDSDVDHSNGTNTTALIAFLPGIDYINIDAGLAFGVLPVKYTYLKGEAKDGHNLLSWQTTLEINALKFNVQKYNQSTQSFETIGLVQAHGNSTVPLSYAYKDESLNGSGTYTYRLEQVDYDGTSSYSQEVQINVKDVLSNTTSIYPNPAYDKFSIDLAQVRGNVKVELLTADGKILKIQFYNGEAVSTFDLSNVPKGIYNVKIEFDGKIENHKLIVIE